MLFARNFPSLIATGLMTLALCLMPAAALAEEPPAGVDGGGATPPVAPEVPTNNPVDEAMAVTSVDKGTSTDVSDSPTMDQYNSNPKVPTDVTPPTETTPPATATTTETTTTTTTDGGGESTSTDTCAKGGASTSTDTSTSTSTSTSTDAGCGDSPPCLPSVTSVPSNGGPSTPPMGAQPGALVSESHTNTSGGGTTTITTTSTPVAGTDACTASGGGGGEIAVEGEAAPNMTPVAAAGGGGPELPFTGLPIAWVVAFGIALMLSGSSMFIRTRLRARSATRR